MPRGGRESGFGLRASGKQKTVYSVYPVYPVYSVK